MVLLHHRYADSGHGTDPERRIKPRKLSDHLHSLHPLVSLACKFCESDSGPLCSLCNAGIYSEGENRRWTDILQIPLSIVFTRFLDLFTAWFDFTDSGFAAAGRLVGVGLGTLIAMIGVGRVIALFNHLFQEKLKRQAFPG